MSESAEDRQARSRERTIQLKVRFFTNGIAEGKGRIRPRHAWTRGMVAIERNDSHGIVPGSQRHFISLMELPLAIEKVLIGHGVQLHLCSRMDSYVLLD